MSKVRGAYGFEIGPEGTLLDDNANLERLRRLFRDGAIIAEQWGPGDPGDFDHGAWHVLCHLAGASAVIAHPGGLAWCGITHVPVSDTYEASIAFDDAAGVLTLPVRAAVASGRLAGATITAYVEGTSQGHIAARGIADPPGAFNGWPRQMFDKGVASPDDGGTVWEHWSTTRDLRPQSVIGHSVLAAWLELVALLGGRFIAAVARGRREHSHPEQLVAMVRAGVLTAAEATWDVTPQSVPPAVQDLLYEARPADSIAAVRGLPPSGADPCYFMFSRRIDRWSSASQVKSDLGDLG